MPDPLLSPAHEDLRHRVRDVRVGQVVPFIEQRGWDHPLSAEELKSLFRMAVVAKVDGGGW